MKKKGKIQKQHVPIRYLRFKGCFGGGAFGITRRGMVKIKLDPYIDVYDNVVYANLKSKLEQFERTKNAVLSFKNVSRISLQGGLYIKAFIEEYEKKHNTLVTIQQPNNRKVRAILKFLEISHNNVDYHAYEDIECWSLYSLSKENSQSIDIAKEIKTVVLPKCNNCSHRIDVEFGNIASAVAEAVFNCNEHAYTRDGLLNKWYLGVGEYPESHAFSFCVYDRGIGIKDSMLQNRLWKSIVATLQTDNEFIEKAVSGMSGVENGRNIGRGKGLPSAIESIKNNGGHLEIFSGKGAYSTLPDFDIERKDSLTGTMVVFSIPFKYIGLDD